MRGSLFFNTLKPKEKESLKQKLPEMKAKADAINQKQDKGKELKKEAAL